MVETHTCTNGLRIVSEAVPTVRSMTIGIWVKTGSRNETAQTSGMSHLIEHMLFKGTKTRSAQDIAESFDSIGGQVNAFTSKEYTCYYARVIDSHKEFALELLTDMFFHSTFSEEELQREKKVIIEEIKMYEDTPDDLVHDLLASASFGDHPLGRPIIGTEDLINAYTREDVIKFKNETYTPNNVVVSVAGNIDDAFLKQIERTFNQFDNEQNTLELIAPEFLFDTIEGKKEAEQAHLCYGYQGISIHDENIPSLLITTNVFGGSMSSRLFQEVREKRGLAYSVFSYHSAYRDSGLVTIYAGTNQEQIPLLRETIQDSIALLIDKGITDKELYNSKQQIKGSLILGLESMNNRMTRNGRNELLLGRHRDIDELSKQIDEIDHTMIQQVIEGIFDKNHAEAIVTPK